MHNLEAIRVPALINSRTVVGVRLRKVSTINSAVVSAVIYITSLMLLSIIADSGLYADTGGNTQKKPAELPKSGLLAGTLAGGYGGSALGGPWGGVDAQGGETSPIQASASRLDDRNWLLKVFNNSEDKYVVNIELEQRGSRNQRLKNNSFLFSLKGGESAERRVPGHPASFNSVVKLKNWKKTVKTLNAEELNALIAEKKKELADLEGQLKNLGGGE